MDIRVRTAVCLLQKADAAFLIYRIGTLSADTSATPRPAALPEKRSRFVSLGRTLGLSVCHFPKRRARQ